VSATNQQALFGTVEGSPAGPDGLRYRAEFISEEFEAQLGAWLRALRFDPIVLYGQAAKRTARFFTTEEGPSTLSELARACAEFAGVQSEDLNGAYVQHYPPASTMGWHHDHPRYGVVIGVSLLHGARMRFRRGEVGDRETTEIALPPRSVYVLDGPARSDWQHSIPPTEDHRYSITFRTLR
jgi:alkylated DNA repair dioxygenase AlkB